MDPIKLLLMGRDDIGDCVEQFFVGIKIEELQKCDRKRRICVVGEFLGEDWGLSAEDYNLYGLDNYRWKSCKFKNGENVSFLEEAKIFKKQSLKSLKLATGFKGYYPMFI